MRLNPHIHEGCMRLPRQPKQPDTMSNPNAGVTPFEMPYERVREEVEDLLMYHKDPERSARIILMILRSEQESSGTSETRARRKAWESIAIALEERSPTTNRYELMAETAFLLCFDDDDAWDHEKYRETKRRIDEQLDGTPWCSPLGKLIRQKKQMMDGIFVNGPGIPKSNETQPSYFQSRRQ
ncbi:hypothetical protein GGR56DRAFT_630554 [Xylariaceae sp. FL0804]|nr:hypothetical protein GGR56DRAFT_630554 [Xylariaceae sp. FL0804]